MTNTHNQLPANDPSEPVSPETQADPPKAPKGIDTVEIDGDLFARLPINAIMLAEKRWKLREVERGELERKRAEYIMKAGANTAKLSKPEEKNAATLERQIDQRMLQVAMINVLLDGKTLEYDTFAAAQPALQRKMGVFFSLEYRKYIAVLHQREQILES